MIVFPLVRSVRLKAATASSRAATLPMFVRTRPSRARRTISLSWARSGTTTKSTVRPSAGRASVGPAIVTSVPPARITPADRFATSPPRTSKTRSTPPTSSRASLSRSRNLISVTAGENCHAMRASLLASAIASMLRCSRFDACSIQGHSPCLAVLGRRSRTTCAACTNSVLTYLFPRLDILPRMVRSPVDSCFGIRPSQAAKSRPCLKPVPLPIAATTALETIGPTQSAVRNFELKIRRAVAKNDQPHWRADPGLAPIGRPHCQRIDRNRSDGKSERELPTAHERSGRRSDRLQRSRGSDRQRHWLQAGARFCRLAWPDTEAGVDRGPHHPGEDIQARKQIREDTVRAGCTRCPRAAAKDGKTGTVALDRAGIEAAPPQHAGNRAR